MMLLRMMDMDDGTDEGGRGPRGLFDFEWSDRYARGGLPSAQDGVMGNLVAAPKGPDDPVWSILDQGLPWPVRRPYPAAGWPFDPQPLPSAGRAPHWSAGAPPWADGNWRRAAERQPPSGPAMPLGPARVAPLANQDLMRPLAAYSADDTAVMTPQPTEDGPASVEGPEYPGSVEASNVMLAQAGGTPPASTPPARSSLDYSLDAIERNFRNTASGWRKQDLTQSATNLQWFLDGTGGTRFISREEARGMEPIRDGEQVNTARHEGAFMDGGSRGHGKKLLALQDGQTITIKDEFDRDYTDEAFVKHAIRPQTRDFALAFGNTKPHSPGQFTVTRKGDEFHIEGDVHHIWKDRYQFHPDRYLGFGGFLAKGAAALEQHRRAKPFDINSTWARRLIGKIRIENGELKDPVFSWEDVDPWDLWR